VQEKQAVVKTKQLSKRETGWQNVLHKPIVQTQPKSKAERIQSSRSTRSQSAQNTGVPEIAPVPDVEGGQTDTPISGMVVNMQSGCLLIGN